VRGDLPESPLGRPAPEGARRLLLGELDRARRAREALAAGEDAEALHDFRVALRRFRSLARSLDDELGGSLRPADSRRLRRLARATNRGRDAEVALARLGELEPDLARSARPAVSRLRRRIDEQRVEAYEEARGSLAARFDRLEQRLSARLSRLEVEIGPARTTDAATLAERLSGKIVDHRRRLWASLAAAREGLAPDDLHRARIRGKRLRYLLEPLALSTSAAEPAVDALKLLQDDLGEINDLGHRAGEVAEEAAALEHATVEAATSGDPAARRTSRRDRTGLLAVAERIGIVATERRARAEAAWLEPRGPAQLALSAALDRLESGLSEPSGARPRP
jgi:CHAD domain-containing protein